MWKSKAGHPSEDLSATDIVFHSHPYLQMEAVCNLLEKKMSAYDKAPTDAKYLQLCKDVAQELQHHLRFAEEEMARKLIQLLQSIVDRGRAYGDENSYLVNYRDSFEGNIGFLGSGLKPLSPSKATSTKASSPEPFDTYTANEVDWTMHVLSMYSATEQMDAVTKNSDGAPSGNSK